MNLYVMRHGTTIWNEIGRTQGHSNNRLSKEGKIKVEEASKSFKNTHIDIIIASPLMRTMQTSNIMNRYHHVKIIKDKRIIEIDQGVFTGRLHSSFTDEEKEIRKRRDKNYGIENYTSVYNRAKEFLEDILSNPPAENILIVTHNAVATMLEKIITGQSINWNNTDSKLFNIFGNAEIKHFSL